MENQANLLPINNSSSTFYENNEDENHNKIYPQNFFDHPKFDCTILTFFVNGQRVDTPSVDPRTTLAAFLREKCILFKFVIKFFLPQLFALLIFSLSCQW